MTFYANSWMIQMYIHFVGRTILLLHFASKIWPQNQPFYLFPLLLFGPLMGSQTHLVPAIMWRIVKNFVVWCKIPEHDEIKLFKYHTFCTPFKSPQFGSFLSFPHLAYLLFLNRVRKSVQPGFETYNCVSSETVPWLFVNTILYLPSSFDLMLRMQSVTVLVSPSVWNL